ncbi:hypothetical protein BYT27DRAFT_7209385 [Phlegmacium glaucopus]|nr:hypothetical protein BYT27DRAFT_7209385 [Phlegmacium glaucopus]
MTTNVNSKVLGVLDPHQVSSVMSSSRTSIGGYPVPGPQTLTVASAMNKDCFVDDNTWRLIAENGDFDDIVVGSGFCALAYIDEALRLNPFRKILLLERGGFWLPDHFQNLPLPFQFVQRDVSETFPWELSSETAKEKINLSGSSPFFGGRSAFWSIWSPCAIDGDAAADDLMDDFPEFMKRIVKKPDFYRGVDRLLRIQNANQINDPVFQLIENHGFRANLQGPFDHYLDENLAGGVNDRIPRALSAKPARLATGVPVGRPTTGFRHFSTVGSLLSINEFQNKLARRNPPAGKPIMMVTDVVVEHFEVEPARGSQPAHARVLHTSRGPLTLRGGKTNVILATGAIPATTILMNSIKEIRPRAGSRLTAHFRSQIKARFMPDRTWFRQPDGGDYAPPKVPVISACHVRGRNGAIDGNDADDEKKLQWHIQLHGTYVPKDYQDEMLNAEERAQSFSKLFTSLAPDNGDMLTPEQLDTSEGYVIISCSTLGELPKGTGSKVELNKSDLNITTNVRLHLNVPKSAKQLEKNMEQSTIEAIKVIAHGRPLQYWNRADGKWETVDGDTPNFKPHINRVKSLFHEASTTFMTDVFVTDEGDVEHASVDKAYRPFGLANPEGNVYVTGAGLFPTAGSWNPTPTIVGFAQHLAKTLVIPPKRMGVFTQDQLGRPYIIGFKTDGNVAFWSFSRDKFTAPLNAGVPGYRKDRHISLLADITGNGLYDLVAFGNTHVRVATRGGNVKEFNNFENKLGDFTYDAGWRVDKHIRYTVDVRNTGRADIIGFGDAGVFLSKNNSGTFTEPSIVLDDLCYDKGWRLNKHLRFLADFYGQGFPDIIGFGETSVVIAKNRGNWTFEVPQAVSDDFTFSSGWRIDKHVRTLANVTRKDRVDIVGFFDDGVYVAINEGNGTVGQANRVLDTFGYNKKWRVEKHLRFVVDISGNGLGDIVGFGEGGVYVSKNRGNGTFEETRLVSRDFGYEQGWRVNEHQRFMADVTGNGCADIVGFKDNAAYVAFNDGQGNFGHRQLLFSLDDQNPDNRVGWDGWNSSNSVLYVKRLDQ